MVKNSENQQHLLCKQEHQYNVFIDGQKFQNQDLLKAIERLRKINYQWNMLKHLEVIIGQMLVKLYKEEVENNVEKDGSIIFLLILLRGIGKKMKMKKYLFIFYNMELNGAKQLNFCQEEQKILLKIEYIQLLERLKMII